MTQPNAKLPRSIQRLLGRLRRRIRWYVWLEGLTLAIAWIGLAYWIGLALDYTPVVLGSSEMPAGARLVLLVVTAAGLAFVLERWLGRRLAAHFGPSNLALLIEKYFPQFDGALLTAVEVSPDSVEQSAVSRSMLQQTVEQAERQIGHLPLARVFNFRPLARSVAAALIAILSIALFALLSRQAFGIWSSRWLLLSDDPWPRRAHIELLGFVDGKLKVAEGSDVVLRVRAEADRPTPPPELCTIYYELDNGEQGRANMSRDGEPRDGYQFYQYQGPPFKGILDGVLFDVVGFDHRLRNQRLEVVKTPSIIDVRLDCQLPEYTGRLPRQQKWSPGTSLPLGSRIRLTAQATKPLSQVTIEDLQSGETRQTDIAPEGNPTEFSFEIPRLQQNVALSLMVLDQDGVPSQKPYQLTINAVEDLAPQINILLRGIGNAITPRARIPIVGEIQDDYGVQRCWFELAQNPDVAPLEQTFTLAERGQVEAVLDLQQLRDDPQNPVELEPGQQVALLIRASDFCDLKDSPQIGESDVFSLDVVTADELLAMLEARELNLKRRFEQTIAEMLETRDSLLRIQADFEPQPEPSPQEPGEEPEASAERQWSVRLLRVQRARQQGEKSQQEVVGVAASFSDIREELINNRVDTEERKIRLQDQIVEPLERIAADQFPSWQATLQQLENQMEKQQGDLELSRQAVRQTDEILLEMQRVLEKMIELESYNELVDLVRSVLQEQEELLEKTRQERAEQTRSLLED